jgi:hypothetical protein
MVDQPRDDHGRKEDDDHNDEPVPEQHGPLFDGHGDVLPLRIFAADGGFAGIGRKRPP